MNASLLNGATFTPVTLTASVAPTFGVGQTWTLALQGELQQSEKATPGSKVVLVYAASNTPGAQQCYQVPQFPGDAPAERGSNPLKGQQVDALNQCQQAASAWQADIEKQLNGARSPGYTLIAFLESGEICYNNRLYGIQGDPIYVAVYTNLDDWSPTRFEPCSIEPDAPAIYVSTDKVRLTPQEASRRESGVEWRLHKNTARRCFNSTVDIRLGRVNDTGAIRFNLNQHSLYRATLQLGALFTTQHVQEFDIRTEDGQNILYSRGPTGRGVEYTASLVVYSAPRYLISLFSRQPYGGRDLVHDQQILDRIGAVIGIGLTQPGRRFIAGGTFEVLYGINLMYVADILRAPQPVGATLNAPFDGTKDDIRTQDRWTAKGIVGLSLDLLYVKELFSGRITP
ncbi:hypothetical protein [Myxococcus faecalis]|uniref:hypothetical protein n=1 Tax=Myxococcus faecalis TaxID=3115646 RepID=UPI003CE73467